MIQKQAHKRETGQGLLEFALILPVLLLVVVGTAEFGRLFAIYSNLFNAAREGTRYAMVNGDDLIGILDATLAKVALIDPSKVTATVTYDSGPGTPTKGPSDLLVGDRVIIAIHYDVEPMSPLLEPLMSGMTVDTQSVRTVAKVGDGVLPEPPNQPPVATFTYSCTHLDCTFDASGSADPDGTIATYTWDFGDGNAEVATGATTSHSYAAGGTYTVNLTVTDDEGATGTHTESVTVIANLPPVPSFTFVCTDLTCSFDATSSSDSDGTIVEYAWDFGDTETEVATGATTSHSYGAGGTYTVVLTVKDDDDATGSGSQDVTVIAPNLPPMAAFTYECNDLDCTFTSTSSDSDGIIVTYAWDFGDGKAASGVAVSHTYESGGTYTVSLIVTDDDGATDIESQTVSVTDPLNLPPVAAFTYECTDLGCTFTSTSTDSDGTIVDHAWDFGDGKTGSGAPASHRYASGGTYPVTLTVTDDDGATGSGSQDVTAVPPPPIEIWEPCNAGIRTVMGTAKPGAGLRLRDVQDPTVVHTTVAGAGGVFTFDLDKGMVAGHVIVVEGMDGYGAQDWAPVEGTPVPDPTRIELSQTCGAAGNHVFDVNGYGWPAANVTIYDSYQGADAEVDLIRKNQISNGNFVEPISISDMQPGLHMIKAVSDAGASYSAEFRVPCPAPGDPNLIVESITLVNADPVPLYEALTFAVSIKNVGAPVEAPFSADLFLDPALPISPLAPPLGESAAWATIGSLYTDESVLLTFNAPAGVSATGTHEAYVVVDSSNQVVESDNLDNLGGPATFGAQDGPTPTPEPSPTPAPPDAGAIGGSTWLFWDGAIAPQGRIPVYCYDSGMALVAETISDLAGNYLLQGLPPGTYTVTGESMIGGLPYTDTLSGVVVNPGETTPYVTLYLH